MKTKRYIAMLVGAVALFSACQESLEDTYEDYAGDGEIRYIGKCEHLLVSPGWKRIIVSWANNEDQIIKKVKLKWRLDEKQDSILLERGTTEYSIESLNGQELEDGNYEISVCGVDAEGKTAIPISTYGRPYTYEHKDVQAFNRLVSDVYVIRDRLILFFFEWQDNMKTASLDYTKADGTRATLELNKELCDELYYMLPDPIDPDNLELILHREGELPGCEDVIVFEPYSLSTHKVYDADFMQEMKRQYGYSDVIPEEWADTVRTLYFDWSLSSFNSLLNFPSLEKVVLGSRRYLMSQDAVDDANYGQSDVVDANSSSFVLEKLNELNDLKVIRYNNHFKSLGEADYIENIDRIGVDPALESIEFIDLTGLEFTEYPESDDFDSHLEQLTDGDFETAWLPPYNLTFYTYDLTLDLGAEKTLKGMRFVQNKWQQEEELAWSQENIMIKVSKNGVTWFDATYVIDNQIGKTNGEVNYIYFSEEVKKSQYRYVSVELNTAMYGGAYRVGIAEISLW